MLEIIEKYKSISFIGMSKNAGKTTTLNYFIDETRGELTLGLSSIGRDGETLDRVTGTEKPKIYIYKGTIVSTASACLKLSDVTLEILEVTDISTPMGKVVLARAVSDGFLELAGPSTNNQTKQVIEKMLAYGADKVFVDGALSRKSFASPAVAEATILSTGAALSSNTNKIIEDTIHNYHLLTTPIYPDQELLEVLDIEEGEVAILDVKNEMYFQQKDTIIGHEKWIVEQIHENTKLVYTSGAITDVFVDLILRNTSIKTKFSIVAKDGTKLFISQDNLKRLEFKGIKVFVAEAINLAAITVNPYSANDYFVDSQLIIDLLKKKIQIPIFDVKAKEGVQ